jgi:hypothetical protein
MRSACLKSLLFNRSAQAEEHHINAINIVTRISGIVLDFI